MGQASLAAIEQLGRKAYAAFSRGDLEGMLALCADDVVFTVPARVTFAGAYSKATFPFMIGKVMELSSGTFREEIVDILVSEQRVLAYLDHRLERNGKICQYYTSHMWTVKDGKFTSWRELPDNVAEFESVWG